MSNLKPCPFCGATPRLRRFVNGSARITCPQCHITAFAYRTDTEAIAEWNKRQDIDGIRDFLLYLERELRDRAMNDLANEIIRWVE